MTQTTSTPQSSQTVHTSQNITSTDALTEATVERTQPRSTTPTLQTITDRPQSTPMSTRVASTPT